jgi:uncharacterized protein involved in exopolysaccharide biosynthesis
LREALNVSEPSTSAENVRKMISIRIEKQSEYMTQQSLFDGLNKLTPKQMIGVLPSAVPDTLLNSLIEQLTAAEQRQVSLLKDLGPDHPACLSNKAAIKDLNEKINARVEGVMLGLAKRTESLREGLAGIEKELGRLAIIDIERARELRPYFEAKRELEDLERFDQVLRMKIASEKIETSQLRSAVQIVDSASAPLDPHNPYRQRGLLLVVFGFLLEVVGVVAIRSGGRTPPSSALVAQPTPCQ